MKSAWLWGPLLAFGFILAQSRALAQHSEHGDPDSSTLTEKDKCRSECHVQHCDQWRACNENVNAGPGLEACHKQVEEDETRCQKGCEAPKS